MTSLDEVFDALADALELERELGARTVEIDRSLLTAGGGSPAARVGAAASPPPVEDLRPGARDAKALAELGWKAERGIDEMCEDAWRWQKKNPYGYKKPEK